MTELTLCFASLKEDVRDDLVDLANELEHGVIGEVLEGKLALSSVTRVLMYQYTQTVETHGLAEDGVAVTGDDLATLEGRPDVLGNLLVGRRLSDLGLHLLDPAEDLLVGETGRLGMVCSAEGLTREGDRQDRSKQRRRKGRGRKGRSRPSDRCGQRRCHPRGRSGW